MEDNKVLLFYFFGMPARYQLLLPMILLLIYMFENKLIIAITSLLSLCPFL